MKTVKVYLKYWERERERVGELKEPEGGKELNISFSSLSPFPSTFLVQHLQIEFFFFFFSLAAQNITHTHTHTRMRIKMEKGMEG